jgi:nickel-dependent lactate racemase
MTYFARGSRDESISDDELRAGLHEALAKLGPRRRVLLVPPDVTRLPSMAGRIAELAWEHYRDAVADVLPATGTHFAMTEGEMDTMFGRLPHALFRQHQWKENLVELGRVPAELVRRVSGGLVAYDWPAEVDRLVAAGGHDLILSIGQVVPHEVVGIAGYNKNILIGTGGRDSIHRSHYLGAVYGMERMMGRVDTPVRAVLAYATEHFLARLPIVYVHTVIAQRPDGGLALRGLFVGDDEDTFRRAAALAVEANITMVDEPLRKVVVYLDPAEFKSTWLGNKAIYRTRMAIADGGELVVLAPGVRSFGEDPGIDRLIRRYGYFTTPQVLALVQQNADLRENLAVAAHLIHGSSEGRFTITYCPGGLSRAEVEHANFRFGDLAATTARYDPARLRDGWNDLPDGERVYCISKPALGLWAHAGRFVP